MRLASVVLVALSTVSVSSVASAATHPSLLFGKEDVPKLKARLDGPLKLVRDSLAAAVNGTYDGTSVPKTPDLAAWSKVDDRRAIADTLQAFAFSALVFRDDPVLGPKAKKLAHDYLGGICAYSDWVFAKDQGAATPDLYLAHMLHDVSLAYDWLYDELSDAEKSACQKAVAREAPKMLAVGKLPGGSAWWIDEYLQNHHWINNSSLGVAGFAFDGELAGVDSKAWIANTQSALEPVKTVLDPIAGGGWHEGFGYADYGLDTMIPFSLANVRLAGGKDFADNGFVHDAARLRMFAMPPSKGHAREYPVYGDYSGYDGAISSLGVLAYHYSKKSDPETGWYLQQFLAGGVKGKLGGTSWPPSLRGLILGVILWPDAAPSAAPKALDFEASDLSLFTARSGWEEGSALVAFKTGVFGGHWNYDRLKTKGAPGGSLDFGHDHCDDMNVWMFADGEWLTANVPGYWIGRVNGDPEANRTRYANSLLVDGVGQLGDGPRSDSFSGAGNEWFFSRQSSIALKGTTAHHSWVLGAGSKLYDAKLGLEAFGRTVLFLDRKVAVVHDVVKGSSPHRYDAIWHAIDSVEQETGWLKLKAKNDRVLGVRVLSPVDYAVATEVQSGLRHEDKFDSDGSMTAALVHPKTDVAATSFLEVLVPARGATWASRAKVDPLGEKGLTVDDGEGTSTAVLTDDPTETQAAGDVKVTGMIGATRTASGKLARALLGGGSALDVAGVPFIRITKDAPATIEVEPIEGGVSITGETSGARIHAPSATKVLYNGAEIGFDQDGDDVVIPKSGDVLPGDDAGTTPDAGSIDAREDAGPNAATPEETAASDGCGCTSAGRSPGSSAFLLLAVGLLLARRQR